MEPSLNDQKAHIAKKAYSKPDLQVYGNLRQITNSVTLAGVETDPSYSVNRSH
jgi:hypothetical protein